MSKVPANFIGLSTTIGIQQPIGTYGGQIYLQKWCQPMVFPDVLYWPINYYHRYLKTYRHLYCLQKWCQPMVEIVFPDGSPYRAQELIVERWHLRNYNSRKQVRMKISTGTEARSAYLGCLRNVAEPTAETRQDLYPLTRAISPDSASLLNSTETWQHDERRVAEDQILQGQIRKELGLVPVSVASFSGK